jgi:hypothetical protein
MTPPTVILNSFQDLLTSYCLSAVEGPSIPRCYTQGIGIMV